MDLSQFIDVPQDEPRPFFDANALAHETIFDALLLQGVVIEHYPLWTETASQDWLQTHYQVHVAEAALIGASLPADLSSVDWTNDAARQAWLLNHYLIHQQEALALNL